jgi:zeaxanthin glucosyltransferase
MKIIFDIFPAFGHQHSSYKLAKLLQDEGHYICYLGEYKYFHDLPPFFSRRYINPHIFSFIENCNSSMWKNIFVAYKEIKHKYYYYRRQCLFQEYDKIIESIRPDLIILDHHYIQKAILYHKYNIPVIAVQTAPSSQKVNGIPPFNSFYIPKDSFISKVYTAFLWKRYVGIKHLRFYLNKYIYLGKDHISEVKSIAKEFNYNLKANIDYN